MADVPVESNPEGWALRPGDMRIMPPQPDTDALIREYAEKAEKIYADMTAGDYTWLGLLSEFTRKLQGRM